MVLPVGRSTQFGLEPPTRHERKYQTVGRTDAGFGCLWVRPRTFSCSVTRKNTRRTRLKRDATACTEPETRAGPNHSWRMSVCACEHATGTATATTTTVRVRRNYAAVTAVGHALKAACVAFLVRVRGRRRRQKDRRTDGRCCGLVVL